MEKLKDIKSIEIIPVDFTVYIVLFFLSIVFVVIYVFLKREKKESRVQKARKALKKLDFNNFDDKTLAYRFTINGFICKEKHYEDEFFSISSQLEKYKYKKYVDKIDEDLLEQMQEYIKVRV